MKKEKYLCILIALCILVFILVACEKNEEESHLEQIEPIVSNEEVETIIEPEPEIEIETETNANIQNPVVEYDSVEDAVIHVGHLSSTPDIYARYNQKASVINDTLIQIIYSNDSGEILRLREERRPSGDISGNYNSYDYEEDIEIDNNIVTIKGDSNDSINLVIWNDGAYSHSLDYISGVSLEEVKAAVSAIK